MLSMKFVDNFEILSNLGIGLYCT